MARQTIREALKQLMDQSPQGQTVFRQGSIAYQLKSGQDSIMLRVREARQSMRKG